MSRKSGEKSAVVPLSEKKLFQKAMKLVALDRDDWPDLLTIEQLSLLQNHEEEGKDENEKGSFLSLALKAIEREELKPAKFEEYETVEISYGNPSSRPDYRRNRIPRGKRVTRRRYFVSPDAVAQWLKDSKEPPSKYIAAWLKAYHRVVSLASLENEPSAVTKNTYLNIIGGLLRLLNSKERRNQAGVVSEFLEQYGEIRGLKKSNLDDIFARANTTLEDSLKNKER